MKKILYAISCIFIFIVFNSSVFAAPSLEMVKLHPEDYVGQMIYFEDVWIADDVSQMTNTKYELYAVEKIKSAEGEYIFTSNYIYSYKSDIYFLVSRKLADLILLDPMEDGYYYKCNLTVTIKEITGSNGHIVWFAFISKVELQNYYGDILRSLEDDNPDLDGIPDTYDNCPSVYNLSQSDIDEDSIGDDCDECNGDSDSDGDGALDCNDECIDDPLKTLVGICGCGVPDTDIDKDGTLDCIDECIEDPYKTSAGICGCGVADIDTDNDSYPDCNDGCPSDPLKTVTGVCGCGIADTDTDTDGTPDCNDIDDDDDGLIDSADIGPLDPLSPCLDMDYFAVMPILSSFSSSDTDRVVFFDISDSICFEMISCVKQARLCDSTIIYGGSGDIVGGNGSDIIVYRYDYEGNYSVSISLTEQDNRESYTDYFEITAEIVETPLPLLDFSILVENSTVTITPVDIDSSDADIISLVVFWGDRYRNEYPYPLQEDISHQYTSTGTDYHIRLKMLNTDEEVFNYTYMNDEDLMVSIP